MPRRRILIIAAVIAGVLLLCACSVVSAYFLMNTPLAPALTIPTEGFTPFPQILPDAAPDTQITPQTGPQSTALPTATAFPTGSASNCGQSGSMNILVMGVDAPSGFGVHGPLVIKTVRIDFSRKTAAVFSLPRDLWLPITGLESFGITQARLGESYLIAQSNGGFSAAAATNLVAQNLYKNFGLLSDHYVTGKLSTFAAMIDTVGGITVNIPVAYDATPYHGHYFGVGPYTMNGSLALEYAVARSGPAQWSGMDRQSQVLMALFQKIFSPETISKLPSLIPQFLQAVTTDLTLQQVMDLVCVFQTIPREKIIISGVGPSDVTYGASGVLYPNFEAIRSKVQQFLNPA